MQTASYMNGNNIGGAGTVSGTTGDFTNLKATGLTLGGNTGKTSATAYDIWAANAKKATNADYATSAGSAATAAALSGNIDVSKITGLDSKIQTAINSAGSATGVLFIDMPGAERKTSGTVTAWFPDEGSGRGAWRKGNLSPRSNYPISVIKKSVLVGKFPKATTLVAYVVWKYVVKESDSVETTYSGFSTTSLSLSSVGASEYINLGQSLSVSDSFTLLFVK